MHKTPHRRREITQRILTYIFMSGAVIVAVALALFIGLGYSFDKKTGQAERGGLLQLRSFPSSASVSIDQKLQSFKTSGKATLTPGQHSVVMSRDKYRSWSKNFWLHSGELLWLNARLVPRSVTTSETWQFKNLSSTLASPDKKYYAAIETPTIPTVTVFDLTNDQTVKASQIAVSKSVSKAASSKDKYTIEEWDLGGRYLLVKHVSGKKIEWLRLDRRQPEHVVNITKKLGFAFSVAHFAGDSGNLLYALGVDGSLRKLNLEKTSLSDPIATDVREFQLYKDNQLIFVRQFDHFQTVSVYKDGDERPTLLRSYVGTEPKVHADLSSYFDDDYAAISDGSNVAVIKNPAGSRVEVGRFDLNAATAKFVYFSNNGQFVVAQNGATLASFDIERQQDFDFSVPASSNTSPLARLHWLDDFRLQSDFDGSLSTIDFDGSNLQRITNVTPGFSASLSNDSKRLYSIGANLTTKKPVLQSSAMVAK